MTESNCHHARPSFVFNLTETNSSKKPPLAQLEASLVNCVLSKSIDKLAIIQQLLPNSYSTWSNQYQPMSVRMTTLQRIVPPDTHDVGGTQPLGQVQKSRYFLQNVLEEAVQEIAVKGTYSYLEFFLCCEIVQKFSEICLREEYIDLKEALIKLEKGIVNVREIFKETSSYLSDLSGQCMEQAIVNAWVQAETVVQYTNFNEQSKIDQNTYKLQEKENTLYASIIKCDLDSEKENMISAEVENHLLFLTSNLQKKLEFWTKRYNEEIDSLDVALLQLNSKKDEQKEKYETLLDEYRRREELVEVMQAEADEREQQLKLKWQRERAARVIQTWWRKILFQKVLKRRIGLKGGKVKTAVKNKKNIKKK